MATFTIEPVGGTGPDTCVVYNNGNQQCHLRVSLDLESLLGRPLFPDEMETLKLAEYDASTFYDQLDLPDEMTASQTKNDFDAHPDNISKKTRASPAPRVAEVFDFYVSTTANPASFELMAVIKVHDDENPGQDIVYTTHFDDGVGNSFESSVTVVADAARVVPASELIQVSPESKARSTTKRTNYIWELPNSLTIRERALELDGNWETIVLEYLYYRDLDTGGINSVHECKTTTQTEGTYNFTDGRHLSFYYNANQFGSGRCYIEDASISGNLSTPDEQQKVRLLDNYGTEQNYVLDGDGSGINIR